MKKIRRRAAIEADEKIKKLMDELNEPTSTEQQEGPQGHVDSFSERMDLDRPKRPQGHVDSFSERMDLDSAEVTHRGLSLHSTRLDAGHSLVDLTTYSRGKRLFFTPHSSQKNKFVAYELDRRISIPINGLFSLMESSSLSVCGRGGIVKGDLLLFQEPGDSFWSFGVLVFPHYLLPGFGDECEYDIWEWTGDNDKQGIPNFFREKSWSLMNPHFRQRTIPSRGGFNMKFVNIVRGREEIVNVLTRNRVDSGIQCSKFGPCSLSPKLKVTSWREHRLSWILQQQKPPASHTLLIHSERKRGKRRPVVENGNNYSKVWMQDHPKRNISENVQHRIVVIESTIGSGIAVEAKQILPSQKNLFLLPSIDENDDGTISFGFVTDDVVQKMSLSTLEPMDYDLSRVEKSSGIIDMLPIENSNPNVCTKIFAGTSAPKPDHTFDVQHVPSSFIRVHRKDCMAHDFDGYVPLSCSLFDSKTQGIQVTMTHVRLIRKAIGSAGGLFQRRKRCIHGGELSYIGPRDVNSHQSQPSPSEGPNETRYQYYRKTISHVFWPFVLAIGSLLASTIVHVRHYIHPYLNILRKLGETDPKRVLNVCRLLILTVSFYCSLHIDSDQVTTDVADLFISRLVAIICDKSVPLDHRESAGRTLSHVKEWGVGVPTTCGYQFVSDSESVHNDVEVVQYFCCVGLGICFRIRDHWTHLFLAHCFSHMTSVPLFICNGKIHVGSHPGKVVFAWGTGNPAQNANSGRPVTAQRQAPSQAPSRPRARSSSQPRGRPPTRTTISIRTSRPRMARSRMARK